MAWTQTDLDALELRIATARKAISYDDRSMTEQDLADLLKLRALMKGEIADASPAGALRTTYASFSKL